MNDPLNTIDAELIEKVANDSYKTIHKCTRQFADIPACQDVAQEVKRWIEEFKPYIPLIQALRNPGMRKRHWEQVRFYSVGQVNLISIFLWKRQALATILTQSFWLV